MSEGDQAPAPSPRPAAGCLSAALLVVGIMIVGLSGLCGGASLLGGVIDLIHGDATLATVWQPMIGFLLVSGVFLAVGIGLLAWARRLRRRP